MPTGYDIKVLRVYEDETVDLDLFEVIGEIIDISINRIKELVFKEKPISLRKIPLEDWIGIITDEKHIYEENGYVYNQVLFKDTQDRVREILNKYGQNKEKVSLPQKDL